MAKKVFAVYLAKEDVPNSEAYLDSFVLSIFNLSGGTAQSGRFHCLIKTEPLLNFAGRADFSQWRTQYVPQRPAQ